MPASRLRITLYVQHLLGSGHLVRTMQIAQALHDAKLEVTLVSGGQISPHRDYRVIQLPVLKTKDGDFLTLLDANGVVVDEAYKTDRAKQLVASVFQSKPDILIFETWPFGRRQMEFELLPLLEQLQHLHRAPMIVASIRDILQRRKPKRRKETLEKLTQYFSLILVHGDKSLVGLEDSFEEAVDISCPIEYSGYIGKSMDCDETTDATGEILVSTGGGGAGMDLIRLAAEASIRHRGKWRILVGQSVTDSEFSSLKACEHSRLVVERNRNDFPELLKNCAVSVSQFGYNTAMDIVQSACPAVVVPYMTDGETEQHQRANLFARKTSITVLPASMLSVDRLLSSVDQAITTKQGKAIKIKLDGAKTSAILLRQHYLKFLNGNI